MPLVTVTVQRPKSTEFKDQVLSSVHSALVASGVPETDRFQRVLELDPVDFRYDPSYPDLGSPRGPDFVLIEIVFAVGRSVNVKRQIAKDIVSSLASFGMDPEGIMIHFSETRWENWSFGGGRLLHA